MEILYNSYNRLEAMKMKLLASDFDQTLLFESKMKIRDVESIKSFQKEGNLFGLCTGRSLKGVLEPSLPYQLTYDFYILLSGALILDRDFHVLYESLISYDLVKDIYTFNHQQDMSVVENDERYKLYKRKLKISVVFKLNYSMTLNSPM